MYLIVNPTFSVLIKHTNWSQYTHQSTFSVCIGTNSVLNTLLFLQCIYTYMHVHGIQKL